MRVWLGKFLVLVGFLGLLAASTIPQADLGVLMTALALAGVLLASTGIGMLGRHLSMTGRKQRAAMAALKLADDRRAPVLYLRSFADDEIIENANVVRGFIQLSTQEEQYAKIFNRIGPFVAIGDPRDGLPDLGAARIYVGDGDWKTKVSEFLAKAQLVVLRVSWTEGLLWELRSAVDRLDPKRLLLLIPGPSEHYDRIQAACNRALPKPLPDLPKGYRAAGKGQATGSVIALVRFRSDWSPEFLLWGLSYTRTLRPVFDQLGVP